MFLLNQSDAATKADYSCAEEQYGSGVAACVGTVASGSNIDTSSVGAHTFTVNTSDNAGNTRSKSVTYFVHYNFSGFYQPVSNPGDPVPFNDMKAGASVPVKFSLAGNQGLAIFATSYPTSVLIACPSESAFNPVDEAMTASTSNLQYDAMLNVQQIHLWLEDGKELGRYLPTVERQTY